MPFSTKEVLDKAEERDKRTFYVRHAYMLSLQPRWGGSYQEMSAFAKQARKYSDLNPRLWTLQGEADADRAYQYYVDGNYTAATKLYTQALKFGDRVNWFQYRAACYYKQGMKDEAIADYKRILYYIPTDMTAQQVVSSEKQAEANFELNEITSVNPNINGLNIKYYAVLPVEHQVEWLSTRSEGRVVVMNNTAKIERMLRQLGYEYIDRSNMIAKIEDQRLSLSDMTNEKAQQIGKVIKADAVIITTITDMGKDHSKNLFYENISIRAISVTTGQVVWSSQLKGSVAAGQDACNYSLILDSIESKLYERLQVKLQSGDRQVK